jgi:hypothetical protein
MFFGLPPGKPAPIMDCEARTDVGPYHLAFWRATRLGTYDKECPFVVRHVNCDGDVAYEADSKDPPASKWKCRNCTAPGDLLFRDLDLQTMSMVRLKQLVYVARQHSSTEDVQKFDYNPERGHGHYYLRPMTREERHKRQLRIIAEATQTFAKSARKG